MITDNGVGVTLQLMLPEVKAATMRWVVDHQGQIAEMVAASIEAQFRGLDLRALVDLEVHREVAGTFERMVRNSVRDAVTEATRDLEMGAREAARAHVRKALEGLKP